MYVTMRPKQQVIGVKRNTITVSVCQRLSLIYSPVIVKQVRAGRVLVCLASVRFLDACLVSHHPTNGHATKRLAKATSLRFNSISALGGLELKTHKHEH